MTAQVKLAEGQAFVEGRSTAKARELLDAAKEAGREGEVLTTSFGYIVPKELVGGDAKAEADEAAKAAEVAAAEEAAKAAEAAQKAEDDGENKAVEFDPSEAGVEEVHEYIKGADDAERERVLAAEREGKNRVTVLREYEGAK